MEGRGKTVSPHCAAAAAVEKSDKTAKTFIFAVYAKNLDKSRFSSLAFFDLARYTKPAHPSGVQLRYIRDSRPHRYVRVAMGLRPP